MADSDILPNARDRERRAPAAADAIAFTGGLGIAVGVFLLTGDFFAHGHGRPPGVALFAVLVAVGFLALGLLPHSTHAAAVTLIAAGIPGALAWWILPHAHRFADIRPFLILTILAWGACWLAPRTRGRAIFIALALIFLWLWMLGEAAGTDAYSASPIPSPPAHTMFSLSALHSDVTIDQLDPTSQFYPLARACALDHSLSCDSLYTQATPGSDFQQFADTCGGTQPAGSGDQCEQRSNGGFTSPTPIGGSNTIPFGGGLTPGGVPIVPGVGVGSHDKSLEIGLVSLLLGLAYLGGLFVFDRRRRRDLGTAFVIPGVLALFTGTEVLGNAAHHAWFGGLLTFVAGIGLAMIGDIGGRRFTTWTGGVFAALGVYTFAADATNFKHSFSGQSAHLVRPALITIAFGLALVALAWWVAMLRTQYRGPGSTPPAGRPGPDPFGTAPFGTAPFGSAPPAAPVAPGPPQWPPGSPPPSGPSWQPPPPAPPPSAPWQPPAPPGPGAT